MRHIEISDDQFAKLTEQAISAGYEDVSAFLGALAAEPSDDPRGPMTEEELRASAAECDRAIAEVKTGGGRDFREAMLDIGRERGFPIPE